MRVLQQVVAPAPEAYRSPTPRRIGARRNKADMAAEPTAGGVPAINIGTDSDADLALLAKVRRGRVRRLAMRDGHPLVLAAESRLRDLDAQHRRG